ncbi:amino acid adenylation domain-containing protein [Zooshikella marina]|uniref:amino acid adenylation domain-containing protein n=1 Tax=Zooshikella ganghwensis TaxID=202772 RepID=UPI001BB0C24F|nr:amino acid adenylation domain-containing protein [Zooshikella ganghwensis]MBU2706125.1 amino acid adenylation domain-containing protein [Zooshikella ganghwensis]
MNLKKENSFKDINPSSLISTKNSDTKSSSFIEIEQINSKCLPDLLMEQVLAYPDRTAVVCDNTNLSYRSLAEKSSNLAVYLQHIGVMVDECIGLFVDPSFDLMIGAWGILFSGSAYLPLSPEYPEDRLRYMIADADLKVIFTQEKLRKKLSKIAPQNTKIITLEDAIAFTDAYRITNIYNRCVYLRPNNLAYIIYTSGSTGKPKGVMIEHHSIVNQMLWLRHAYAINQNSIILQKTPMSFDAAQWEILSPCCGSQVIMGSAGVYRDPERLIRMIIQYNVTTLQCVPTLLQALLNSDDCQECHSLKQIFSGGEALSKKLALECSQVLSHCTLVNLYGPTECTINASAYKVTAETLSTTKSTNDFNAIPIGNPVDNTEFYILDNQMIPVSTGEIGELFISGNQLARGYLHRPELTSEKFIDNPFCIHTKLYRTGDLAYWNADGSVQFAGRVDNQVKLRGYRVELDEIKLAIEAHAWVQNAAVFIRNDARTGFQNLIACIELNAREAALMDQGINSAHHLSKKNKLQVKAQLSNPGCKSQHELADKDIVELSNKRATQAQRHLAFSRKTYRFFEGGSVSKDDILKLLSCSTSTKAVSERSISSLSFHELSEILRNFGQYHSHERLLPKYAYASPGALYATQLYLEIHGIGSLTSGYYYYHPVYHQLILIKAIDGAANACIKVHFIGKKSAIEPVYKNNILEVLEMETGHMLGLFDAVLSHYQLKVDNGVYTPTVKDHLECAIEDYYLGSFEIYSNLSTCLKDNLDIFVQTHEDKVSGLPAGLYQYKDNNLAPAYLEKIANDVIQKKHVIAINQQVYERSSFGISLVCRKNSDWSSYIQLGRKLQQIQMNDLYLGFMSSGYSSKTGNDLPAAKRITSILNSIGEESGPSYFFLGGRISLEQHKSEGMKEDAIHTMGPAEILKDDLAKHLPDYMVPNRIIIMDALPQTVNGKIDYKSLETSKQLHIESVERPIIPPKTMIEQAIALIWKKALRWESVSIEDDFFESGGNSLIGVQIINKINKTLNCTLPLQVLFEAPTIEKLARHIQCENMQPISRIACLSNKGNKNPVFCWPGLGGYPMSLRALANHVKIGRPFYGVQAYGINAGETPFTTIKEMAEEDIKSIKRIQPSGPYTLWGYSFGARVAFEAAYQLEKCGECVENIFLIAPGSPKIQSHSHNMDDISLQFDQCEQVITRDHSIYNNKKFLTILFSVFSQTITGATLEDCLKVVNNEELFISFISSKYKHLEPDLIKRITQIVRLTYDFKYTFHELNERKIKAPLTIFKAKGDDYSFIENSSGYSSNPPVIANLNADHYAILKEPELQTLLTAIERRLANH